MVQGMGFVDAIRRRVTNKSSSILIEEYSFSSPPSPAATQTPASAAPVPAPGHDAGMRECLHSNRDAIVSGRFPHEPLACAAGSDVAGNGSGARSGGGSFAPFGA
jgi:hypothetical protein